MSEFHFPIANAPMQVQTEYVLCLDQRPLQIKFRSFSSRKSVSSQRGTHGTALSDLPLVPLPDGTHLLITMFTGMTSCQPYLAQRSDGLLILVDPSTAFEFERLYPLGSGLQPERLPSCRFSIVADNRYASRLQLT